MLSGGLYAYSNPLLLEVTQLLSIDHDIMCNLQTGQMASTQPVGSYEHQYSSDEKGYLVLLLVSMAGYILILVATILIGIKAK